MRRSGFQPRLIVFRYNYRLHLNFSRIPVDCDNDVGIVNKTLIRLFLNHDHPVNHSLDGP